MDNFIIIETDIHLDGRREENYTNGIPESYFPQPELLDL